MTFRNSTFQNQKFGASSGLNEKYLLAAKRSTAVFDPSKLPLADGASVGSFPEIFGRYTATQATSAFKPLFIANGINGKPVVRSDGSDDVMESPALFSAGGGGVGFIGVVKFTRVIAEEVIFHQGESVTNKGVGLSTLGTGAVKFFFYGNDLTSSTGKISAGGTYILTANFYGGTRVIRLNGVQIASDTPVGKNTTSSIMRFFRRNGKEDGARYLSGDSGQFILRDGGFSASEIAFYEKYLSAQYAIPLS